jgi:hypothetical protein
MKTPIVLLMACASLAVPLLLAGPAEEIPHWHADWPTAQRLAKKANKPVFAVFVCKH